MTGWLNSIGSGLHFVGMVLLDQSLLWSLGTNGYLLIFMFLFHWFFRTLDLLSSFISDVVRARSDRAIQGWTWWLKEDLSTRPNHRLRPDLIPPSPCLVDKGTKVVEVRLWCSLILLMLNFVRRRCHIFVGTVNLR